MTVGGLDDGHGTVVLRLRPGVDWRDVQGEVVALDVGRSVYVATNVAGAVLWSRLSEGATRQDLARALVDEFDVADHTAEADVDRFLDRLHELDLIEGQP
jgi:hypothetical protein